MSSYRPDHYMSLGIRPDADADTIRAAYRTLAKQVHPDASAAEREDATEEATERFVRLQEAYDVLRDPLRRAQYDAEQAREAERRRAARQPIVRHPPTKPAATQANPQPATIARRDLSARLRTYAPYLAGMGLLIVVTVGIAVYQHYTRLARERQITVIRVDPNPRPAGRERTATALTDMPTGTPSHPGETGILAKEIDRLLQRQVDRVEEAKKKMEAQKSEFAQQQAKSAPPQTAGPVPRVPRVDCSGAGRTFVMTTDKDGTKFSTDEATPVTPRISDLGTGVVLVSRIESTNRLAIGFKKGLRDATTVLMFDSAGSVQHSFKVECSAAAF